MPEKPLLLFIDAYDSFSNNIISLLETTLDVSVRTVKIDDPILLGSNDALYKELSNYAAVVCGPGPGNVENLDDVGLMRQIWKLQNDEMLPVLGICLGFQSLCFEFGGVIKRLKGPQHGIIRKVTHIGEYPSGESTIFHGVGELNATLYQSLCVDIGHSVISKGYSNEKWSVTDQCPNLLPLAWVEHDLSVPNDSGIKDEKILVAVQHIQHPFWALQYHPESICTNGDSIKLIENWFAQVTKWNQVYRRGLQSSEEPMRSSFTIAKPLLDNSILPPESISHCSNYFMHKLNADPAEIECFTRKVNLPTGMAVPEIIERMNEGMKGEHILLESSNAHMNSPMPGKFSIIALDIGKCTRIEYTTTQPYFKLLKSQSTAGGEISLKEQVIEKKNFGEVWNYIASELESVNICAGGYDESPFLGGFMGYTTYELGLERINVSTEYESIAEKKPRPDLCFVWVNSSIVIDHANRQIFIQKLAPTSDKISVNLWIENIIQKLQVTRDPLEFSSFCKPSKKDENSIKSRVQSIHLPDNSEYESKVLACQSLISAGSSYELCLTDQTIVCFEGPDLTWEIYKKLRISQPAPYASYICLGPMKFISASPERFLKWDEYGKCELRPMKGTVKKSTSVTSLTQAIEILQKPKEKAENLMIVDLARHDLYGICGSGNVTVPSLMVVEEYASVFQMVSVISGQIRSLPTHKNSKIRNDRKEVKKETSPRVHTGLDVLFASLPPGSMTGAPKKRSCEILREIEDKERGLYSGVVGYLDVRGRGDWSVNIRCLFQWDDEMIMTRRGENMRKYHIGAGGAITTLSTVSEETEEMLTKLNVTLSLFRD
ncbi:Aminodeoxychorismate synthase [Golovinomyces cichoracearum]|uniref:aminodeoxychorismate synthase n=1 Tax=Golovinomyces cichoracearum TaxID=62708 RepID=A0A420HIA1_9PEZI|nr:Aminodeoxychorismate synthase [Golovinomyces cichoracearum]